MSEIKLNTFPNSKADALTMLYLENQDLTNVTPEQLVDKYLEAHEKVNKRIREKRSKDSVKVLR
ncbi:hypothetical protein [Rummeliibacillus sp. POC4]|uniref:hypothetical protein n=1 Tax=Rummeliibacillus sp. POC4 TaxID=2305899 RepID=UPI000E66815F|nr:hypothetical protein [Rummeliibacillus sp. POC4]RIJ64127.1 hypothetical protein D1606_11740 [Rummeliibacillus sp. POC4]